jgi:hypothetical protein
MELGRRVTSRSGWAEDRRRARLILLQQAGYTWVQIRDRLGCNDTLIARWSKRFGQERLAGLFSRMLGKGNISPLIAPSNTAGAVAPAQAGDGPFPERHGTH